MPSQVFACLFLLLQGICQSCLLMPYTAYCFIFLLLLLCSACCCVIVRKKQATQWVMLSAKQEGRRRKKVRDKRRRRRRRGQTQLWVANGMPYFAALSVLSSLWAINANEMAKQVEERKQQQEVKRSSTIKIQNIIAYFCAPSRKQTEQTELSCEWKTMPKVQ